MTNIDVWFTRYEGKTLFVLSEHDQEPNTYPTEAKSVSSVLRKLRESENTIEQVGILPPEMIGLE